MVREEGRSYARTQARTQASTPASKQNSNAVTHRATRFDDHPFDLDRERRYFESEKDSCRNVFLN